MDSSNINRNLVHLGVPLFIFIYFFMGFYPKYIGDSKEIIPFSLFNLYSLIPYDYEYFDLMIIEDCGESKFLFYDNQELSRIERKHFLIWFREMGNTYFQNKRVDIGADHPIIQKIDGQVYLVRMKGDYIETADQGTFDLDIIKRIK